MALLRPDPQVSIRAVSAQERERQTQLLADQSVGLVGSVEEKDLRTTRHLAQQDAELDEHMHHAAALVNGVTVQRDARRHLYAGLDTSVREMHQRTSAAILDERQERHRNETQLELLIDEKVGEVRGYLAEDAAMQKESERYTKEICDEVCHLYKSIEDVRKYRAEKCQTIGEAVRYKLDEIHDAVAAEQRLRVDSRDTLLGLLGQMGEKMENELEASRRERHEATDRLIRLMETVLPRLDLATKKKVKACTAELNENSSAGQMAHTLSKTCQSRPSSKAMLHRGRVTEVTGAS